MICRRLKKDNDKQVVVWFGSYGKNTDGTAKFFSSDKHDNYSTEQTSVKDSLIQRLSVIKEELWYDVNYGIPLLDKVSSKITIDMKIMDIINNHPDVTEILEFNSTVFNHIYSANVKIQTNYGDISFNI